MKKIQLAQATWLTVGKVNHVPGEIIDVEDGMAESLISTGSAIPVKEVKGNADKAGSNSSKT